MGVALKLTHSRQDPESPPGGPPSFLLRLPNDEDLIFNFTFTVRQTPAAANIQGGPVGQDGLADTVIQGLTFIHAPGTREIDNLVTREFHADPNLHKRSDVSLIGDGNYATNGNENVQFQWSWKWRPPKPNEDRGGGWRNSCSVCFRQHRPRFSMVSS